MYAQLYLQRLNQDFRENDHRISGPKDIVMFKDDKIVLQLQKEKLAPIEGTVKDGWKITPLNTMEVRNKHKLIASIVYITTKQVAMDELMNPSELSPRSIKFSWTEKGEPQHLDLCVYLQGSVRNNFITISLPQFYSKRPDSEPEGKIYNNRF